MAAKTEDQRPQGFSEILATIRPSADAELGRELAGVIEQVIATGKPGAVTYTLNIRPAGSLGTTVEVGDAIKAKRPEMPRATSIAFVGDGNSLHRNDPGTVPLFGADDVRDTGANADHRTGEIREV